jgi:hypothetical protein
MKKLANAAITFPADPCPAINSFLSLFYFQLEVNAASTIRQQSGTLKLFADRPRAVREELK